MWTVCCIGKSIVPMAQEVLTIGEELQFSSLSTAVAAAKNDWILLMNEGESLQGSVGHLEGDGYRCVVVTHTNDSSLPGWTLQPAGKYAGIVKTADLRLFRKHCLVGEQPVVEQPLDCPMIIRQYTEPAVEKYIRTATDPEVLGILQKIQGNFDKSIKLLQSARSTYHLGTVYLAQQKYGEARKCFHKVIQEHPKHSSAYFGLGVCAVRTSDFYSAKEFFRNAILYNPTNITAHNNLGVVLEKLDYYEDAIAVFQDSIALSSHNPAAYFGMAAALVQKEQYPEAVAALRQAREQGHPQREKINAMIIRFSAGKKEDEYDYEYG